MDEEWKEIKWFEGKYFISNQWRLQNNWWLILKPLKTNAWYFRYWLCVKRKVYKYFLIHRLVMLYFIWESSKDVNHKDWNKFNNILSNLEYCTKSENMKHASKMWLLNTSKGKNHYNYNKLGKYNKDSVKIQQLTLSWDLIKIWDSIADIRRTLKISWWNICLVCKWKRNQTWGFKWEYFDKTQ